MFQCNEKAKRDPIHGLRWRSGNCLCHWTWKPCKIWCFCSVYLSVKVILLLCFYICLFFQESGQFILVYNAVWFLLCLHSIRCNQFWTGFQILNIHSSTSTHYTYFYLGYRSLSTQFRLWYSSLYGDFDGSDHISLLDSETEISISSVVTCKYASDC